MTRSFIVWARRLPRRKGLSTFRFFCVEMPGANYFRSRQVALDRLAAGKIPNSCRDIANKILAKALRVFLRTLTVFAQVLCT